MDNTEATIDKIKSETAKALREIADNLEEYPTNGNISLIEDQLEELRMLKQGLKVALWLSED